jgi:hypothetical protein
MCGIWPKGRRSGRLNGGIKPKGMGQRMGGQNDEKEGIWIWMDFGRQDNQKIEGDNWSGQRFRKKEKYLKNEFAKKKKL